MHHVQIALLVWNDSRVQFTLIGGIDDCRAWGVRWVWEVDNWPLSDDEVEWVGWLDAAGGYCGEGHGQSVWVLCWWRLVVGECGIPGARGGRCPPPPTQPSFFPFCQLLWLWEVVGCGQVVVMFCQVVVSKISKIILMSMHHWLLIVLLIDSLHTIALLFLSLVWYLYL